MRRRGLAARVACGSSKVQLRPRPLALSAAIRSFFVPEDEGANLILQDLEVRGELPAWLQGKLLNAGPGKWHINGERFQGLLDCQAMVQEVSFESGGRCSFRRRHVATESLRSHTVKGQIAAREMYSRSKLPNMWERLQFAASEPPLSQNGFQMVSSLAGERLMTTHHACQFMEVSLKDLSTVGPLHYADDIEDAGDFFNTEPTADSKTGEIFFGGIRFNPSLMQFELALYCFEASQSHEPGAPVRRRLIRTIPLGWDASTVPAPHQVWVTENYVVCMTSPLRVNILRSAQCELEWIITGAFSGEGRSAWKSGSGVKVYVVSRKTGDLVNTFSFAEDVYPTHVSNIFERPGVESSETQLVLDVLANELDSSGGAQDETAMFAFPFDAQTEVDLWGEFGNSVYRRYELHLDSGRASVSTPWLGDGVLTACAKVNEKVDMQEHQLSFSIGSTSNFNVEVVKLNHETGETLTWTSDAHEKGHELEFIPDPSGESEDAGVILCWLTSSATLRSRLVVIDGATMQTQASVHLPASNHSPILLHGTFVHNAAA